MVVGNVEEGHWEGRQFNLWTAVMELEAWEKEPGMVVLLGFRCHSPVHYHILCANHLICLGLSFFSTKWGLVLANGRITNIQLFLDPQTAVSYGSA